MSGVLKSIGKVFRKIVKVVRKVALPALAIGAVVLTGGAALGALPALGLGTGGVAGVLGSMGITGGVASALTTAATSATIGAGMSVLTGGDPIKGATKGFITGGLLGGATQALGAAGAGAGGPMSTATDGAVKTIDLAPSTVAGDFGSAAANADLSSTVSSGGGLMPTGGGGGLGGTIGKLGGFVERNPIMVGSMMQGLGTGLTNAAEAKELRKREQRERDSYQTDGTGLWNQGDLASASGAAPVARPVGRLVWDPKEMRLRTMEG